MFLFFLFLIVQEISWDFKKLREQVTISEVSTLDVCKVTWPRPRFAELLDDHPGDSRLSCLPTISRLAALPGLFPPPPTSNAVPRSLRRAVVFPPTPAFGPNNLPSRRRAHAHTADAAVSTSTERYVGRRCIKRRSHTRNVTSRRPQARAGDKA